VLLAVSVRMTPREDSQLFEWMPGVYNTLHQAGCHSTQAYLGVALLE